MNKLSIAMVLATALVVVFVLPSAAQTTSIPNANFEQALIDLGIDSDGIVNGQVLTADISGVTSLDVQSKSIGNLTGIQDFAALLTLNVGFNNLSSLDVSSNTALTHLVFTDNNLPSLDLSSNSNLVRVESESGNAAMHTVVLGTHLSLTHLKFDESNIGAIDVSGAPALRRLNAVGASLSSLDLSSNPLLKWLLVGDNNLGSIDLSNNTALITIWIDENPLTSLDLSNQTLLSQLDVFDCPNLASVDLKSGNNGILTIANLSLNPSLLCAAVDDPVAANADMGVYAAWLHDLQLNFAYGCGPTGIEDGQIALPTEHRLGKAYPNPFNPTTKIAYNLSAQSHVTLTVFDARGRVVRTLVNESRPPGRHTIVWDGRSDRGVEAASGVYFYHIIADDFADAARIVLLK